MSTNQYPQQEKIRAFKITHRFRICYVLKGLALILPSKGFNGDNRNKCGFLTCCENVCKMTCGLNKISKYRI